MNKSNSVRSHRGLFVLVVSGLAILKIVEISQNKKNTIDDYARSFRVQVRGLSNRSPQQQPSANHVVAGEELSSQALEFVFSRQAAFDEAGMGISWKFRGLGYLYARHNVILAGKVILDDPRSVHIYNVHPNARPHKYDGDGDLLQKNQQQQARDDCHQFTIWVRVYGPEIFAGSAQAVNAQGSLDCYWKFDFEPTIPGEYAVDAKPLLWNSKDRDYQQEQRCMRMGSKQGNVTTRYQEQYPKHSGFQGFKLYDAPGSCCEICNRLTPYCKLWANPAWKMDQPRKGFNGCELFFEADAPEEYIPKSWILGDISVSFPQPKNRNLFDAAMVHDRPHGGEPQYFVGCGWNYWFTLDFPCLSGELDDKVFFLNDTFQLPLLLLLENTTQTQLARRDQQSELPLCEPEIELMGHSNGRWVQETSSWWTSKNSSCPPFEIDGLASKMFDIVTYDGNNPHCWHRDNMSHIGENCVEANCRNIYPISIWNSRARVENWFGVWRERSCDYVEFTDDELQQCINTKKITKFTASGKSIASFLKQYLRQRVSRLQLYNATKDDDTHDTMEVELTTAAALHKVRMTDDMVADEWNTTLIGASRTRRVFLVNGFYLSSERDLFTHVERMVQLNRVMEKVLLPHKGYELLNVFDLSAAFTYDTATQRDGMHITGPPMKMAITKMFHYLCNDVVAGKRL